MDTPVAAERLLTIPQLAELLSVPVPTLYHWRATGQGPHGFRVGKQVRYRPADVERWIEELATKSGH